MELSQERRKNEHNAFLEKPVNPLGDEISSITLIRISGSDLDVVNAARVSFGKISQEISEKDETLIRYLMEHKHTSPFEHNQLSFRVKAPQYVIKQWMRHRMNSYNEISHRYVKASTEFYIPRLWRTQDMQNHQASVGGIESKEHTDYYRKLLDESVKTYEYLLEQGVCREQARGILPRCIYSEFIFTCNLHSLMHFLRLRLHKGAQWEIQQYARAMLSLAEGYFPVSLREWRKAYEKGLDG